MSAQSASLAALRRSLKRTAWSFTLRLRPQTLLPGSDSPSTSLPVSALISRAMLSKSEYRRWTSQARTGVWIEMW